MLSGTIMPCAVTTIVANGRRRLLEEADNASTAFNWGATTLANALLQAHDQLHDENYLSVLKCWAQRSITVGGTPQDPGGSLWKMGAGSIFAALAHCESGSNAAWNLHLRCWLDHLDEIPRLRNGTWSSKWDAQQIWVDSLMTLCPTLLAAAECLNRPHYLQQAVDTCLLSAAVLQDKQTGLWWHAWDQDTQKTLGTWWCRGNAWALMA
ncbi:MAG: glycoside hydrolase family 88 protein, partial [Planctomycetota bacterium]